MIDKLKNFGKIFEYRDGFVVCNHSAAIFLKKTGTQQSVSTRMIISV
jgi:hypothetical protein